MKPISIEIVQNHFLNVLLEGKINLSNAEVKKRAEKLGFAGLSVPCFVACIALYFERYEYDKDENIFEVENHIRTFLKKSNLNGYSFVNANDYIYVIMFSKMSSETEEILIKLHTSVHMLFGIDSFIGIGSEIDDFSKIPISASEAMEMLSYKYQYADRGVINIRNIVRFRHNLSYGNNELFNRVIGCFQDGNLQLMEKRFDELVSEIRCRPHVSNTSIKRTSIELTVHLLHIASNSNVDVDNILNGNDPYNWIMQQEETPDIKCWIMGLASNLITEMNKQKKSKENSIIQAVCEYINSHYSDSSLGLQLLAEMVGLSSPYLSQLFKTEIGVGVSNYITNIRIEHAKEILQSTNIKNQDIALQLGFLRANYFSKVFKEQTGCTPGEYRKRSQRTLV